MGAWRYPETLVELWAASILLLWYLHMLRSPHSVAAEPVARAMEQMAHVPMSLVAVFMLTLAIVMALSAYYEHLWLRRMCLIAAFAFFVFVDICFWRFVPGYPGAFICTSYPLFTLIRFLQLCGRKAMP